MKHATTKTLSISLVLAFAGVAAAQGYVRWQDPREAAFSVEVPRGWRVQGGTFRRGQAVRPVIELVSPDGRIQVCAGDVNLPSFQEPNPMMAQIGIREGQSFGGLTISRFASGTQIAAQYARTKLAGSRIRVLARRQRPDVRRKSEQAVAMGRQFGMRYDFSVGEIEFTSGDRKGYALAETMRSSTAGMPANWNVTKAYGYVCDPASERLARQVLDHMVRTTAVSSQWQQNQIALGRIAQKGIMDRANIRRNAANDIAAIRNSTWNYQQRANAEGHRKFSNYLRDTVDVRDPRTGQRFNVSNPFKNYMWRRNGTNVITGTNTATRPGWNWSRVYRY